MNRTPRYIVFEGIDGSGKTRLARAVANALQEQDHRVRSLAFPGNTSAIGNFIRSAFRHEVAVDPKAMLWLFVAEAKDVEPQITHSLANNQWVICDRHTLVSSRVYQGEIHGQGAVEAVIWPAMLRVPDRVYLLDVSPEVSIARRQDRDEPMNELYETDDVKRLTELRRSYRALFDQFMGARILDGTKNTSDLVAEIWRDLGLSAA